MTVIKKMTEKDFIDLETNFSIEDAEAEMLMLVKDKNTDELFKIMNDDTIVGLLQFEKGMYTFIYVFIGEPFRNNGYGSKAVRLAENMISGDVKEIGTNYRSDLEGPKTFAEKFGYKRLFNSCYMVYNGQPFDVNESGIRPYKSEDFEAAHEIHAVGFHEMRVKVGDFPDSQVEPSNDDVRKGWDHTAHERYVIEQNNQIVACARLHGNELSSIAVKKGFNGQGIGTLLTKFMTNKILENNHDHVELYCVKGNDAKIMYDRLGYKTEYITEFAVKENVRG